MYGATGEHATDLERTAFRKAEKRYKLYKSSSTKSRQRKGHLLHQTDLSDVVDFGSVLELFERGRELPPSIFRCQVLNFSRPVFCLRDHPGFYFIPGALGVEEQCHWVRESLKTFPQPANRTNHTATYGPIHDLFNAVQCQKVLVEKESVDKDVELDLGSDVSNLDDGRYLFSEASMCRPKGVPASILLRKLRWSTLGLQFDWSKRNYDISPPHNKIPDSLALLAKKMATPAMRSGEEFLPEAAIVNYFGPSDMLGGHLDDMEADWSKPIVSISLGCKAIFLLGGKSREDMPVAMFLRSGDIVLMAGEARNCFHGVPRIFTDKENADVCLLASEFASKDDLSFIEYIQTSRININIRQVN